MSDWLCSFGGDHKATCFCSCEQSLVKLCKVHESKHQGKSQTLHHALYPIEALQGYQSPGYLERLGKRSCVKDIALAELLRNNAIVEDCCEQIEKDISQSVWQLTMLARAKVRELKSFQDELKRETGECVREVASIHYLDSVAIKNRYTEVVRNYEVGKQQLVLFRFQVQSYQWPVDVDQMVQYEILEPRTAPSAYRPFSIHKPPQIEKEELIREKQQLQTDLSKLHAQMEALDREKTAIQQQYETVVAQLKKQIADLQRQNVAKNEQAEQVNTLRNQLDTATSKISSQQKEMQTLRNEISQLQADNKKKAGILIELEEEMLQIRVQNAQIVNRENAAVQQQFEAQIAKLKKQVADLKAEKNSLKKQSADKIATLSQQLETTNKENSQLKGEASILRMEVDSLQAEVSNRSRSHSPIDIRVQLLKDVYRQ